MYAQRDLLVYERLQQKHGRGIPYLAKQNEPGERSFTFTYIYLVKNIFKAVVGGKEIKTDVNIKI